MKPSARLLAGTQPFMDLRVTEDFDGKIVELYFPKTPGLETALDLIEYAGRWDYGKKSIDKMGDQDIIRRWLESGEESMIEMVDAIFFIECSRVVSHELVRHRIASYQQESQRFVNYEEEDPEDLFYVPEEIEGDELARNEYDHAITIAHAIYKGLRGKKISKQIARYVLPNATRTRIIAKMNLREWRHVLRLRLHKSAQPEMRIVMDQIREQLQEQYGKVLFPDNIADERANR